MKKFVCILLTLVMVMSLSITAFAENGSEAVDSLTENNTQDITITNTISQGEGSATSAPKYYVGISWNVYAGETTVDRSAEYEWNHEIFKYELRGEPNYVLSGDIAHTYTTISVTNYSNADIGYAIAWTTDAQSDQYFGGIQEVNADPFGVCRANTKLGRADVDYNDYRAVDGEYNIYPEAEGFDNYRGEAQRNEYSGTVTFQPIANLDQLYNMGSITLGYYTVTIGNPPSTGEN